MNDAVPVRPEDRVMFHCRRCGNCCRDLEGQLMLEPLDAYHLARCLRERGEASSIDDVYERYAHTDLLEGYLPIYLMNTVGPNNSCAFLQDGRRPTTMDRARRYNGKTADPVRLHMIGCFAYIGTSVWSVSSSRRWFITFRRALGTS